MRICKYTHTIGVFSLLASSGFPFEIPFVSSSSTRVSLHQRKYFSGGYKNVVSDTLSALSVSELKRLLSKKRRVDFRDCLEKSDLVVDRVMNSQVSRDRQPSTPMMGLSDHEQSLIATFKRVSPSVANIKTNKGHVVTNYHVVAAGRKDGTLPSSVNVKLAGLAQVLDASIVGVEPEKDIVVLKVRDRRNLPRPIDIRTSGDLQVGQSVLAVGNPFGLDDTSLTTGIVSALGRDDDGIGGRPIHGCIQTNAAINPCKFGGPLLDSQGRLIGTNTSIFSPNGAGIVGIGFAIPIDTVCLVVNQIIIYGKVVRPTLGISVVDNRIVSDLGQQLLGRSLEGCLVAERSHAK